MKISKSRLDYVLPEMHRAEISKRWLWAEESLVEEGPSNGRIWKNYALTSRWLSQAKKEWGQQVAWQLRTCEGGERVKEGLYIDKRV